MNDEEVRLLEIRAKRLERALLWIPSLPRPMRQSSAKLRDWVTFAVDPDHDRILLDKEKI